MHHFDSIENKQRAMSEIEFFFCAALDQCVKGGAQWVKLSFVHNPAGTFAITLQQLLDPNGLHVILEWFAPMIQSGRNVSLDNQTRLTICAYSPLQGGAKSKIYNTKVVKKALWELVPVLFKQ